MHLMFSRIGDVEIMTALTEHAGAAATVKHGSALLYAAAEQSNTDMAKYIMKEYNPERKNRKCGATPFMFAIMEGNTDILSVLMRDKSNIDTDRKDNEEKNMFHYALASRNPVEVTKFLTDAMNKEDGRKGGARKGSLAPSINMEVKKLLTAQDSSQSQDTPLHVLAKRKLDLETFEKLFIELEIVLGDLTERNASKETPLHVAAKQDVGTFVEAVLSLGEGDPKMEQLLVAKDKDSNTPLHLATKRPAHGQSLLLRFLKKRDPVKYFSIENCFGWTPFSGAVEAGDYATVKEMLKDLTPAERSYLVSHEDRSNKSPLHIAAEKGFVLTFNLLLEKGADIKRRGPDQKTALEFAIEKDQQEVIESIIESTHWKEAFMQPCSSKDREFDTPLRMLIRRIPDLAEKVLDKCCEKETIWNDDRKPQDVININFDLIEDTYEYRLNRSTNQFLHKDEPNGTENTEYKVDSENHPLIIMANEKKADLLQHPVCLVITQRKWDMYGRKAYLFLLGVYIVLLFALNLFILSSASPITSPEKFNCTESFQTIQKNETGNKVNPKVWSWSERWNPRFRVILLALYLARVVFFLSYGEFSPLSSQMKRIHWRKLDLDLPLIFLFDFLVYSLGFFLASHDLLWEDPSCLQFQVGAVTITLAWINLLLHMRFLYGIGIYIVIFRDIVLTFLKVSVIFFIVLYGFALGFHILLSHRQEFQSPADAFLKTTIMMSGKG